jgi:hypothetical protein
MQSSARFATQLPSVPQLLQKRNARQPHSKAPPSATHALHETTFQQPLPRLSSMNDMPLVAIANVFSATCSPRCQDLHDSGLAPNHTTARLYPPPLPFIPCAIFRYIVRNSAVRANPNFDAPDCWRTEHTEVVVPRGALLLRGGPQHACAACMHIVHACNRRCHAQSGGRRAARWPSCLPC